MNENKTECLIMKYFILTNYDYIIYLFYFQITKKNRNKLHEEVINEMKSVLSLI